MENFAEVDRGERSLLWTNEIEKIQHDLAAAQRLLLDSSNRLVVRIGTLQPQTHFLGQTQDDRQRVVELVRERSRELAERNEPVRNDELAFELLRQVAKSFLASPQLVFDSLALGDLEAQIIVDFRQIRDPLFDPLFQFIVRFPQLQRLFFELLVKPRIVNGQGRLTTDAGEKGDLLIAKFMFRLRVNAQKSQHFSFSHERNREIGNQIVPAVKVRPPDDPGVGLNVTYDQRCLSSDHLLPPSAGRTRVVVFPIFIFDITTGQILEPFIPVEQSDGTRDRIGKELFDLFEQKIQDLLQIQSGHNGVVDVAQRNNAPEALLNDILGLLTFGDIAD